MSNDWKTVPAGEVARIEIGGTPAREQPKFWADQERGYPWASIADLASELVLETAEYISDLGIKSSNVKLVPAGTPIMSFKLTIGRTSLAGRNLYTNEAIAAFFADTSQVDRRYLFHVLPGSARSVITDVAIKGATLNKKSLASMRLPLPSFPEQRRIAVILDTLDEQIETSKRIINKCRLAQKGLLQRIFGVNFDRDVDTSTIEELANTYAGGTPSRVVHAFYGGGIPWVKSGEVNRKSIEWTEETISPAALRATSIRWVPAQTPLIAMYGATAGVVSWTQIAVTTNQAVLAVAPRSPKIEGRWLFWALLFASPKILATVQGSGQPNLSKNIIDRYSIFVPRVEDQRRVVEVLDASEDRLGAELALLDKLRAQKAGLVSDLLTGRVRVREEAMS